MSNKYTLEKKTVYTVITPFTEETFDDLVSATNSLEEFYNRYKTYNGMYITESVVHVPVAQLVACSYIVEYRTPESDVWQPVGGSTNHTYDSKENAKLTVASLAKSLPSNTHFRYKITRKFADNQQKVTYETV